MKSLLSGIDSVAEKIAYQTYTVKHGIEELKVLVPLKNAKMFEADFHANTDHSKTALLEIISSHSGKVRG
jgi:hypothetical protein